MLRVSAKLTPNWRHELRGVIEFLSMFGVSSSIKKDFLKIGTVKNEQGLCENSKADEMCVDESYEIYENVNRISTLYDDKPKLIMFLTNDGFKVKESLIELAGQGWLFTAGIIVYNSM